MYSRMTYESSPFWSHEVPKGAVCADVPSGPLSTLVVSRPGVEFRYRITPADLLWTARMIEGEAGGRNDVDNHAVIWTMLNRFALLTNRKRLKNGYQTFGEFIRAYSTPLQPVLSYGSAKHHYDKPGYVAVGGTYRQNPQVPRGNLAKHLKLQKTCWSALKQGARDAALAVLTGRVASPIGLATEFANTATYYYRQHKTKPTPDQWRAFNARFGEGKKYDKGKPTLDRGGWVWIGDHPKLKQFAVNTFFLRTRTVSGDPSRVPIAQLPSDTVRLE